jgi:NTP pyrophosphatase (non-canonical NTP hydrolase)
MTINSIEVLIREWADDRKLNDKAGPFGSQSFKQLAKLTEESGEIAEALIKKKIDDLKDGIGDVIVVLIILAYQNNTSIADCLELAYNEIKDRTGKTVDGVFIKEEK